VVVIFVVAMVLIIVGVDAQHWTSQKCKSETLEYLKLLAIGTIGPLQLMLFR
jgi:hypothetical protein